MTTDMQEQHQSLVERTEATLEKFKERAEELKGELGDARAATKVQLKAMIARLEKKYEGAKGEFDRLKRNGSEVEELGKLHQRIVSDLSDMKRTIDRRIL